jgi:malonyl-CoA O-methyltransferase
MMKIPLHNQNELVGNEIRNGFNRSAKTYDSAAIFQREIAQRLFERLELMRIQPQIILDLGAGTGFCSELLEKKYPQTEIIAVDVSENMLSQARSKKQWQSQQHFLCANAKSLPLESQSVDLIFSNLFLHWCFPLDPVVAELHRVLKPNGLLLFSMLGPDTFKELRQSWAAVDDKPHVHSFIDMHDVGDALLRSHCIDPVMDMEYVTLHYEKLNTFLGDIKALGVSNKLQHRQKSLMGKQHYQCFVNQYESMRTQDGLLPVTYEVIYGHAWGAEAMDSNGSDVYISPDEIKR